MALTKAERWYRDQLKRSQTGRFTEEVEVTPALAKVLLAHNPDNRNMRPTKLKQFVDDMTNGRWEINGESVVMAKTGELNDGQHRLQAVIDSNTTQIMDIKWGVERSSRLTVDTGTARSAGDHMSISGIQYGSALAACARMVIAYERANEEHLGRPNEVSSAAVIERVNKDTLLRECAIWGHIHKKRGAVGRASIVGFVFYVFSTKNPTAAKLFMQGLKDGIGLAGDSPIRLAREKIIGSPRLSTNQVIEVLFRGWNHWVDGSKTTRIQVMSVLPPVSKGRAVMPLPPLAPPHPKIDQPRGQAEGA